GRRGSGPRCERERARASRRARGRRYDRALVAERTRRSKLPRTFLVETSMRRALFLLSLTAVLAGCGTQQQPAQDDASKPRNAAGRGFTGVVGRPGVFGDRAGRPPFQNTRWPAMPPFTAWGAAESQHLKDPASLKVCSPNGPVFFMSEVGIFPLEFLEAPGE